MDDDTTNIGTDQTEHPGANIAEDPLAELREAMTNPVHSSHFERTQELERRAERLRVEGAMSKLSDIVPTDDEKRRQGERDALLAERRKNAAQAVARLRAEDAMANLKKIVDEPVSKNMTPSDSEESSGSSK